MKGGRPHEESKVWSDMVEALIGAVFVDKGLKHWEGGEFGMVEQLIQSVIL
jgi:dsRNA-specific ribonuclease